ncbi:MAG: MoxR family ATPase [Deltaproteobacteria bacterium]|nr:MoxR family ATPase [Deltaproteobacteria bacterium]
MTRIVAAEGYEADSSELIARLEANIAKVIRGKAEAIRSAVMALVARGHLLIEDVPGVGKTTLARALAGSIGGTFHRIQFTSDLLPSDIIGVSLLDQRTGMFDFKPGAIFANVVLADEINRTTPRTQSALLEAMNDGQVSVDGKTHKLDTPFMVIATQNPEEHYGTYPLPESQMDRFVLRIRLDYPKPEDERRLLLEMPGKAGAAVEAIKPAVLLRDILSLQEAADRVRLSPELADYIVAVAGETRRSPFLSLGISPRGQLAWRNIAKASALADGRDFVLPDDLKGTAVAALSHRVLLAHHTEGGRARDDAERVIGEIVNQFPVPG